MSKRNHMPGLRLKGGIWQIEKRCRYCESGWLRESTGTSRRAEAEEVLIRRLAELRSEAERKAISVFTFEEAAMRYLEDVTEKSSADAIAMHIDQMLPFIGHLPLENVHDGTVKPFVDHESQRGMSPKTVNNALGIIATVLKRAAGKWRTEDGLPWLRQAPPILSRLSLVGKRRRPYPLSWDEQDVLLRNLPNHLVDPVLFAVNTGCREQEICSLRWEWEVAVPELDTTVFVLPDSETKTRTERVIVLNSIAKRIVEARRASANASGFVFSFRGKRLGTLRTSGWRRAWTRAGLPEDPMVMKGVHNLRHTCGRRLRAAGVPLETRKQLLGHASGDITTHYSAAELGELLAAAERITNRGTGRTPALTVIRGQGTGVGNVSETAGGLTA
jgi:integrase